MDVPIKNNYVFSTPATAKVPDPVENTDAVNKQYLYSSIGNLFAINTLGAAITSGNTVTSITLSNPVRKHEFEQGNKVRIVNSSGEYQDFTVSVDANDNDTTISVSSVTANYDFSVGDNVYVSLADVTLGANSGNGFDELFELDPTLGYILTIDDVVLSTDPNVGDGSTAGVLFDEFGIKVYDSTSSTPIFDASSSGTVSMKYLNLTDKGSAGSPAIRFDSDPDTGIFSSGDDTLDFVTAGISQLSIDASGNATLTGTLTASGLALSGALTGTTAGFTGNVLADIFQSNGGSVSNPAFSYQADTDTGIYFPTTGNLAISIDGVKQIDITGTQTEVINDLLASSDITVSGKIKASNGGVTNPSITVTGDNDTGFYFDGFNGIYFTNGGTQSIKVTDTSINVFRDFYVQSDLKVYQGKSTWTNAGADPTTIGQLWMNGFNLVWHDGFLASPLATQYWVNEKSKQKMALKPKQDSWTNNESFVLFYPNSQATMKNIVVSVDQSTSAANWTITLENVTTGSSINAVLSINQKYAIFGASSLSVNTYNEIVITLSTTGTTSPAPSGLSIFFDFDQS